jgi:hypothetical protein
MKRLTLLSEVKVVRVALSRSQHEGITIIS